MTMPNSSNSTSDPKSKISEAVNVVPNSSEELVNPLLIKIIENYTTALNRISVEQTNPDSFDEHYKYIQEETARTIQQHCNRECAKKELAARKDEVKNAIAHGDVVGAPMTGFRHYLKDRLAELAAIEKREK